MPRSRRRVLPHVPHHVILRGNNRRRLFSYSSDYNYFLRLMGDGVRRFSRGGSGKLFEQRFISKSMKTDSQVLTVLAYIDLNPLRAGLAAQPHAYRWSSYSLHTHYPNIPSRYAWWTPSDAYLSLGQTAEERTKQYSKWVEDCRTTNSWKGVESDPRVSNRRGTERPNRSLASQ